MLDVLLNRLRAVWGPVELGEAGEPFQVASEMRENVPLSCVQRVEKIGNIFREWGRQTVPPV